MCPCGQERQWYAGVHKKAGGWEVEGCDPSLLLCSGEAKAGVQCPVLNPSIQERQELLERV